MAPAPLSAGFQSLPPLPTIKLGPSAANSQVGGWACASSRPMWVSPMTSPVRLGVSPAAAPTPTGFFNQRFAWVARSASLPTICPVYLCTNMGPQGATHCSACPVLCHSESGPLGLSVRECGAAGSASGQTACLVHPTLRQSCLLYTSPSPRDLH